MDTWKKVGIAVVLLLLVVVGILIFKALVMKYFDLTLSLVFVLSAFVLAAIALAFIHFFAPESSRSFLTSGVVVMLVLFCGWSIYAGTSPVAAKTTKKGIAAHFLNFAKNLLPDNSANDEVTHQADMDCDEATAEFRYNVEQKLLDNYKQDGDVDKYLRARAELQEKLMKNTALCSSASRSSVTPSSTPAPASTPASTTSSTSMVATTGTTKVFVDATRYNGVGSVQLISGRKFEIKGTGTAVWKNIPVGNPTKYESCGPEGTSPTASVKMTREEYFSNIGDYLCPTALKGALIAKIGNGAWFPVGKNFQGVAQNDGVLTLAVNDVDPQKQSTSNWADNGGGFSVAVIVH